MDDKTRWVQFDKAMRRRGSILVLSVEDEDDGDILLEDEICEVICRGASLADAVDKYLALAVDDIAAIEAAKDGE